MYIVTWNNGNTQVTANAKAVFELSSIFELKGYKYTVSNSMGKLDPKDFGIGDTRYWLKRSESF